MDASHVYVRALALGRFYSHISTRTFLEGVAGQLHRDKEYPFSGVTKSGRVWRSVPESDARSVDTNMSVRSLPLKSTNGLYRDVSDSFAARVGLVHGVTALGQTVVFSRL